MKDEVQAAARTVTDRPGSVDILINNAGIISRQSLLDLTEDHWDDVMATNVKSLLFTRQVVVSGMMRDRWGRIINASSYAAWHPPWRVAYMLLAMQRLSHRREHGPEN